MQTIKVLALRPLKQAGRPVHAGEHVKVTRGQAAELVAKGDAQYRDGDAPEPKDKAKK